MISLDSATAADPSRRRLRMAHLFQDLLSVYGDTGNVAALVVRARRRGIAVHVDRVRSDADRIPPADVYVIGGGQDRDQVAVDAALRRLGDGLRREIEDGAAILAVCGGYQSLGHSYRTSGGRLMRGPAIFDVTTRGGATRFVGPVVAHLESAWIGSSRATIVGFENHSGRTTLAAGTLPLATVEIGFGNNGQDGSEGVLARPGIGGLRGLRIGTYLHGPVLPRNPHLADALLAAALDRTGQPTDLVELDDTEEWAAHDQFIERCRHRSWPDRLPSPLRRVIRPARNLVGF